MAKLATHYSIDELVSLNAAILADPAMKNAPGHSPWIYTKDARRMLDNIGHAIHNLQREQRIIGAKAR
ncbi:MAG: hypothetical protein JSS75_07340 [Bacteroidetes bacterium]|nr:hypothetical protein [Bacteroidota bacterium]